MQIADNTIKAGIALIYPNIETKRLFGLCDLNEQGTLVFRALPVTFLGTREKKSFKRSCKLYITNLYNKICNFFKNIFKAIKSFFSTSKNTRDSSRLPQKDTGITATASSTPPPIHLKDIPEDIHYPEMTSDEAVEKIKQLIALKKNGKSYEDLSSKDQSFLGSFIRESISQPDPDIEVIAKNLAEGYGIALNDV